MTVKGCRGRRIERRAGNRMGKLQGSSYRCRNDSYSVEGRVAHDWQRRAVAQRNDDDAAAASQQQVLREREHFLLRPT